jgi:hypothetical protein
MWLTIILIVVVGIGFVALTGAPYVPSKAKDVERAFTELYPLTANDVLVDIGSGDGKVLRIASKHGARAIGYEIHPVLVAIAKFLSRHDKKVEVTLANFWTAKLPTDTTVVYTFGDSRDIMKMYDKVQSTATANGATIAFISYGFELAVLPPQKTVGAHHLYMVTPLQKS